MGKLSVLAAVVAACLAGAIWAFPARAYPPQSTAFYNPATPFVVCDTHEQISAILDAMKAHRLDDKLNELSQTKDVNNEPVCLVSVIGPVVFESSEHIGLVFDQEKAIDMWISQVKNEKTEFYLLWGEVAQTTAI